MPREAAANICPAPYKWPSSPLWMGHSGYVASKACATIGNCVDNLWPYTTDGSCGSNTMRSHLLTFLQPTGSNETFLM